MIGSLGWSTFKASVIRPLLSKPVIKKISKRIKAESFWAFAFSYHFLRRYWKKGERIRFSRGRKCSLKQMKSLISVSVKLDDFAFLLQNDVKKGRKKVEKSFSLNIIRLSSAICAWKMKVDFITEAIFAQTFSFRHFLRGFV